jgi:hypothetical protein
VVVFEGPRYLLDGSLAGESVADGQVASALSLAFVARRASREGRVRGPGATASFLSTPVDDLATASGFLSRAVSVFSRAFLVARLVVTFHVDDISFTSTYRRMYF